MATADEVLRPTQFAQRLGVETIVVVRAMHRGDVPRIRMSDGSFGIPASALDTFDAGRAASP